MVGSIISMCRFSSVAGKLFYGLSSTKLGSIICGCGALLSNLSYLICLPIFFYAVSQLPRHLKFGRRGSHSALLALPYEYASAETPPISTRLWRRALALLPPSSPWGSFRWIQNKSTSRCRRNNPQKFSFLWPELVELARKTGKASTRILELVS